MTSLAQAGIPARVPGYRGDLNPPEQAAIAGARAEYVSDGVLGREPAGESLGAPPAAAVGTLDGTEQIGKYHPRAWHARRPDLELRDLAAADPPFHGAWLPGTGILVCAVTGHVATGHRTPALLACWSSRMWPGLANESGYRPALRASRLR